MTWPPSLPKRGPKGKRGSCPAFHLSGRGLDPAMPGQGGARSTNRDGQPVIPPLGAARTAWPRGPMTAPWSPPSSAVGDLYRSPLHLISASGMARGPTRGPNQAGRAGARRAPTPRGLSHSVAASTPLAMG